jgi:hypothetical protein
MHIARSSFLALQHKTFIVSCNDLHLALQVSYSMHEALQFLITQIQLLALSQLAKILCTTY